MKDRSVNPIEEVSLTDTTMLRAAVDNDQAAWRDLVESYSGLVYRWVRRAGLQDSDAADVASQVFSSVVRTLPQFRREHESHTFRGWLRRITQRAIADWRRAEGRLPCVASGGSDYNELLENKPEDLSASTLSSALGKALSPKAAAIERVRRQTSPDVWRLFWLVTVEGLTPDEVAAKCAVKVGAVYLAKHRITKRIREEHERGGEP